MHIFVVANKRAFYWLRKAYNKRLAFGVMCVTRSKAKEPNGFLLFYFQSRLMQSPDQSNDVFIKENNATE